MTQLDAPASSGGLIHKVIERISVSVPACTVIVVCHDVVFGGLCQAADRSAGRVIAGLAGKISDTSAAAPLTIGLAGEFSCRSFVVVPGMHDAAGIGVTMVQSYEVTILIDHQELVEGVADIAVAGVEDVVIGVGDGEVTLPHSHHEVGLMVQPVAAGIHLMACADVKIVAVFIAA